MSWPHAGTATNAGVWSKLTFRLNGRGDTCAYTRHPSACSWWACSMMRSARDGSRLFWASWFHVHDTPRRAAPARHPVDVDELAVDLLDPGQELEHARVTGRAAEHSMSARNSSSSAARLGTALPCRSWSTNDVDEPERPGGQRVGEHRREALPLLGGGGALPRLVAHHVQRT